jgi:hypothetical protein
MKSIVNEHHSTYFWDDLFLELYKWIMNNIKVSGHNLINLEPFQQIEYVQVSEAEELY